VSIVLSVALRTAAGETPPDGGQEPVRAGGSTPSSAQDISTLVEQFSRRLQRLEADNANLAKENRSLRREVEAVNGRYDQLNRRLSRVEPEATLPTPSMPAPSVPAPSPSQPQVIEYSPIAEPPLTPFAKFLVGGYDDERGQFVLVRPMDEQRVPFELRVDLFTQARYFNFARSTSSWTDSLGERQPVQSFDTLEVTRNFVQFSGFGIVPQLQFTSIIFSSTAINDTVYLGWINYRFSRALDLRVGNWQVPGTREWLESFRYTLGADRLMATTFFRPNISPGVWIQGEPIENVRYVAVLANSLNRFNQGITRIGSSRAFGGTVWWEPMGDFGPGPSDTENHQTLSPRLGTSVAVSREANQGVTAINTGNPEDTIVRLSDGTPLFRPGALGPNVGLSSANVQLWTVDAALKYRGLGLSGEYFFRWLDGFKTIGAPSPFHSLFDHGGLLQAGYFAVPGKLEFFGRTSFVTGHFGGGTEYGGGINWYPRGSREWRYTFEVLRINHSPAQNLLTGYRAGESGTLFQLQWFTDF
jgi:hypothetical protein